MAEHVYSLFCERALVEHDGIPTFVRCFDALTVQIQNEEGRIRLENRIPGLTVGNPVTFVSFLRRSIPDVKEQVSLELTARDPSDESIGSFLVPIDLTVHSQVRLIHGLTGLPFRGLGHHTYEVTLIEGDIRRFAAKLPVEFKLSELANAV